jgi:hypothetical protein
MTTRAMPDKFLVAFSFAGEQRDFVRGIAEAVEKELGSETVFFDEWFEFFIAGANADLKLQEIYGQRCELAVFCVSKPYGAKPWTTAEHEAIRARQMQLKTSTYESDRHRIRPASWPNSSVRQHDMNFAEQLRVLQTAQDDPAKLALATVDLKYPELSEAERAGLKEALEAAAIPHWCDAGILGALLEISPEDSAARFARLSGLTVIEPFPARGETAMNVHESARLALRQAMFRDARERFRTLSRRAVAHFVENRDPASRIERVYQQLGADPESGADALEQFDRELTYLARPEDRYALAAALNDL